MPVLVTNPDRIKGVMDFLKNSLKNIAISLQANGPAAVIIFWIVGVTALGLFGDGPVAKSALSILAVAGGLILVALANKA